MRGGCRDGFFKGLTAQNANDVVKTTKNVAAVQRKLTPGRVSDIMNGGDFMIEIAIVEDEEKEALRLVSFLDRFSKETGAELSSR